MHGLAQNWAIFFFIWFVFGVIGIVIQLYNMKRVSKGNIDGAFGYFAVASIFWIAGGFNGLLAIIGVVANLMGK